MLPSIFLFWLFVFCLGLYNIRTTENFWKIFGKTRKIFGINIAGIIYESVYGKINNIPMVYYTEYIIYIIIGILYETRKIYYYSV